MPINLYLDETRDPETSLVLSSDNPIPKRMKELVFGETHVTNIYIVDGAGAYSSASGASGATVKVGIGVRGGVPTAGTFTLTFDGNTTLALAYNATAAQIQAQLELLTSVGPGNVEVTGSYPAWEVEFKGDLAEASQSLISGDSDLLLPVSSVNVSQVQQGDTGINEIQFINLATEVAWLNSSWTRVAGSPAYWNGLLSTSGIKLYQLFAGKSKLQSATLEIRVTDAAGYPRSYASLPITLLQTILPTGDMENTPIDETTLDGAFAIPNGTDQVTVTGLALTQVPRRIFPFIIKPAGGLNIFASLVDGSEGLDGFIADLSGMTDSSNYKLGYVFIF